MSENRPEQIATIGSSNHEQLFKNRSNTGAVLILFLTVLVLGATAVLLHQLNRIHFQIENQKQTARVLAQAKEALLGFALTYAETHPGQSPGYLPCPDSNGDGSAELSCSRGGYSVIGHFPWRTLGLPPLRDGSGECLWYAVSGNYKNNPKQILTNTTKGLFTIKNEKNEIIADKTIAIVFAPGKVIDEQNRTAIAGSTTQCGSNIIKYPIDPTNNINNYLDHYNANGFNLNNATGDNKLSFVPSWTGDSGFFATTEPPHTATFIKAPFTREENNITHLTFNDALIFITPEDFEHIYGRMNYWVAGRVLECLGEYAATNDNKYPWASQLNPYDYTDDTGERFGRIPQAPLINTHIDNTLMADKWPIDPHFKNEESEEYNCFNEQAGLGDWQWGWWKEWKETVFFGIDFAYTPIANTSGDILTLATPTKTEYINMIVLVAGSPLEEQTRTNKMDITNYLEGENADGDAYFISQQTTSHFNDLVCGNQGCRGKGY